jgi:hypothetical protein
MGIKKSKKKKVAKVTVVDPLAYDKWHFSIVINKMQECADAMKGSELGDYFQSKADLNREKLKALG